MPISSSSSTSSSASKLANSFNEVLQVTHRELKSSRWFKREPVKYNIVFGHRLEIITLKEPTSCSQCRNFIYGIRGQKCKLCKLSIHCDCVAKIKSTCIKTLYKLGPEESHLFKLKQFNLLQPNVYCQHCGEILGLHSIKCDPNSGGCGLVVHEKCKELVGSCSRTNYELINGHSFIEKYFLTPTKCNYCNKFLLGVLKPQGFICDPGCELAFHKDCKELVNPCSRSHYKQQQVVLQRNETPLKEPTSDRQKYTSIQDFKLIRILGFGSASKVYLARHKFIRNKEFAIKVIKKTNAYIRNDPESALAEMKLLNYGRKFPFLTIAYCCFQTEARLFFVMEFIDGHNLLYHLERSGKFTENTARFYAAELVLALNYLHSCKIVYRDLKLENVLIDNEGHCKLIDFGLSKELNKSLNFETKTFCGTPGYISPEIVKGQNYGFSADWWALGVLTYELLLGYAPFDGEDEDELYKSIVEKKVELPNYLSSEAKSFLEDLLTKDPQYRLGSVIMENCEQAILEHPFFENKFATNCPEVDQWEALKSKQIRPPFIPPTNRGKEFAAAEEPRLTPVTPEHLENVSQDGFQGFSFYSNSFYSMLQT